MRFSFVCLFVCWFVGWLVGWFLVATLDFQFQFKGCQNEVMIAIDVISKECPRLGVADDGLEALWSQTEASSVVNLPIA